MTTYPPTRYTSALARSNARKLELALSEAGVSPLPKVSEKRGMTNHRYYLEWGNVNGTGRSTGEWIKRLEEDFAIQVIDKTAPDARHYVMLVLLGMPVRKQRPPLRVVTKPLPVVSVCVALSTWIAPKSIVPANFWSNKFIVSNVI